MMMLVMVMMMMLFVAVVLYETDDKRLNKIIVKQLLYMRDSLSRTHTEHI